MTAAKRLQSCVRVCHGGLGLPPELCRLHVPDPRTLRTKWHQRIHHNWLCGKYSSKKSSRQPLRHTAPMPSRRLLPRSRHPRKRPPHPPLGAVVMPEQSGAEGVPGRGKRVALAGCGGIYTRIEGKMRGDVPLRTYTGLYGLIRAYTSLYAG